MKYQITELVKDYISLTVVIGSEFGVLDSIDLLVRKRLFAVREEE